ncbi:Ribosomal protein L13 family protein [Trifolium repens]|nr:Ribosomal protein L13 family protein [Trifolium repens]
MLVNVFLIIGIGNEEKRKERSQVAYERKKLVNKLKAKVEKIVDKKLGSQFEVGVCMPFDLCGIFVILLSGCFVLNCLSSALCEQRGRFNEDRVHNFYQSVCDVEDGKSNRVQYEGPGPKLAEMLERDVLETSPGVKWYDVASLTEAKRLLGEAIVLEYSLYGCLNISR